MRHSSRGQPPVVRAEDPTRSTSATDRRTLERQRGVIVGSLSVRYFDANGFRRCNRAWKGTTDLFFADSETFDSLRKLWGLCSGSKKPVLLWVGSGASSWLGYERWSNMAQRFHRSFLRAHSCYDRIAAAHELSIRDYPAIFQRCRDANSQCYFSLLTETLGPRQNTPVYERFLNALRHAEGVSIVTTNVDETLERSTTSSTWYNGRT